MASHVRGGQNSNANLSDGWDVLGGFNSERSGGHIALQLVAKRDHITESLKTLMRGQRARRNLEKWVKTFSKPCMPHREWRFFLERPLGGNRKASEWLHMLPFWSLRPLPPRLSFPFSWFVLPATEDMGLPLWKLGQEQPRHDGTHQSGLCLWTIHHGEVCLCKLKSSELWWFRQECGDNIKNEMPFWVNETSGSF